MTLKSLLLILCFAMVVGIHAAPVQVLTIGSNTYHMPSTASINGDIVNTVVTSLSGVNLSNYDVIYFHEHPFDITSYAGDIRNAISSGSLSLVAEYTTLTYLNTIFQSSLATTTTISGTLTNTTLGTSHVTVTGVGLENGQVVSDVNAMNRQSKYIFTKASVQALGWDILVQDAVGNAFSVSGTYGLGRVFLIGNEILESGSTTAETNYAHNVIQYAANGASVPEPSSIMMFSLAILCSAYFFHKW